MGSQKHIYESVSSSGSHRVCTIRLSVAGSSSYGFGLGRVCSSALFFFLPIRRDLSPNNNKGSTLALNEFDEGEYNGEWI